MCCWMHFQVPGAMDPSGDPEMAGQFRVEVFLRLRVEGHWFRDLYNSYIIRI